MSIDLDTIDASEIQKSYEQGLWLNGSTKTWDSLSTVESLLRSIFSRVPYSGVDSTTQACLRYSWESIQLLPKTPTGITKTIDKCFKSLTPEHSLNSVVPTIASIYMKTVAKNQVITIQEHPKLRQFEISSEGFLQSTVYKRELGKLDFHDQNNNLHLTSEENALYNSSNQCRGKVDVQSNHQNFVSKLCYGSSTKIKILSGGNTFVATMQAEGDTKTFVFRDNAQKIVALALWTPSIESSPQRWEFTLLSKQHQIYRDLFLLALLTHSQKD